ncbi:MAG: ClpXP protease specificity-enhancing factor [Alkalimonas sp.]|nr:ClpXP protease specificity-enhancing factor [Alkalimonas sp.]
MTPNRPYLLRAFYEWIVDNDCTPYLVVDAEYPDTKVPPQFVQNGQIVLNMAPSAVAQMQMGNDVLSCSARFGGHPFALYIPIKAVLAIYAKENGAGTVFTLDEDETDMDDYDESAETETTEQASESKPKTGRSHLTVVK